jgi:hypothetical protein
MTIAHSAANLRDNNLIEQDYLDQGSTITKRRGMTLKQKKNGEDFFAQRRGESRLSF